MCGGGGGGRRALIAPLHPQRKKRKEKGRLGRTKRNRKERGVGGADLLGLEGPIERAGEKGGGSHFEKCPVREVTITIPCLNSISKTSTIYF